MYFYTVLEVQVNGDTKSCIPVIYDDYADALSKLYTILSSAAKSSLPYHSGHILRSDGQLTDGRVFDRRGEDDV